ncbi:hypothetical protein J7L09_00350 [bacterium]|nr:hypothetical protein [bacterium]
MKERKPYVISEDIQILLAEWAREKKFILPPERFFGNLRKEMKEYFSKIFGAENIDMISTEEMRQGMKRLIQQTKLPAVSMDRVYIRTNPAIEVSRIVDESLNDCGIAPRFGTPLLLEQLLRVREKFEKVVLVDDVIFSGKVISEILLSLERIGVKVPVVVAGITIGEGARILKEKTEVEILTVKYYQEVIDEICERDFYPGVPLSGRLLITPDIEIGVPYLLPFGKPHKWASIPRGVEQEFSQFCLEQTIKLWEAIEKISGKPVKCRDLERLPRGLPNNSSRFVDELRKVKYLL